MKDHKEKRKGNKGFAAISGYFTTQGVKKADLVLAGAAIILLLVCWRLYTPVSEVFTKTTDILYGYSAKQDAQGLYYVVDNSHDRLICFDAGGDIRYTMSSPSNEEEGSLYIDDFALADGLVYLSASEWDGIRLSREVIAAYQEGKFVRTIVARDYSGIVVNKHRFHGVTVTDGILSFAETEENAIVLHRLNLSDGKETTQRVFFSNAFNAVSDSVFSGDAAYVMSKNGTITAFEGENRTVFYSTQWEGEEERVPYRMALAQDGLPCFLDIYRCEAVKVDPSSEEVEVLAADVASLTMNFTADKEGILFADDDGVHLERDGETITWLTLSKTTLQIVLQTVWFIVMLLFCLTAAVLVIRAFFNAIKRKYTFMQTISFWIVGTVAVVAFSLCAMLLNSFSDIYLNRLKDQIENDALIVAGQIPEGSISRIKKAEDFDGEAYHTLCDLMEEVFPFDLEINQSLYCNILQLSDDGENAYAVAYLDQSIGTYFPLYGEDADGVRQIYQSHGGNTVIWDYIQDESGSYLAVKVPVYEYGNVVGAVMVGSDTYMIDNMMTSMRTKILLSIAVIMMLIWLLVSEIIAWFNNSEKFATNVAAGRTDALPGHLIRLLVFLVFACYNMTATFLPVWILRNSDIFPASSRDFMASLPITVNIFVIGIMSLLASSGVRRLGLVKVLTLSTACSLCGNLLMFLIPSYFTAFIGLVIDGVGVGLITNATYIVLTYVKNEEDQQWGFSIYNTAYLAGMNFGMLLGSLLAVILGQRPVFIGVAGVWLVLMLMGNLLLRQLKNIISAGSTEEAESGASGVSFGRFLFDKPVISFIVLFQNPYIVFNSFAFYFVPLFCGNMGYDETVASMLIMLYSEIAVLSSGKLTDRITTKLGNRSMYAAMITNIAALMIYAFTQNLIGVLVALALLGTAAAYGKPMQQTWFLKQKQVQRYGEDRAMGVYNFTENIGESVGPIVFGQLMAMTPLFGALTIFCGAMLAVGSGHYMLNRKELKEL